MKDIRHVGMDVDSEKVVVAVAEAGSEVRALGAIPYTAAGEAAGPTEPAAGVLRGGPARIRALLAAHATRSALRRDRPHADTHAFG